MTQPRLVGGRYELGELLGYGGMAEVHRGRDVRLGRDVAIKVLRADLARDPSFLQPVPPRGAVRRRAEPPVDRRRCTTPARTSAPDGTTQPYIVMEYVEGRTLRDILKTEGRLPARRAMEITADVCARARLQPPHGHRAPRHQAGQRDDHPGRRGQGDGLRHRPRASPTTPATVTADRERHRHRAVPVARAGARRVGRRPLRRLLHRLPALRAGHRRRRRSRATRRSRSPTSTCGRTRRCRRRANPACRRALDSIVMKALAKNPLNRYQTRRRDAQRPAARAGQPAGRRPRR